MSFVQLHYTSCETGLANYSGFQFCAITAGVRAEVMREVERLTVYELPRGHTSSPIDGDHEFPINFLYTIDNSSGAAIIARVKYTGTDFSNRPGNYFAHSLVTDEPDQDFYPVFPVELWEAPFWASSQGPESTLPHLDSPPPHGPITRAFIARFIADRPERADYLKLLLTATDEALFGGQKVLLVAEDTSFICQWIAAISYLLGPGLAMRLTFSTYSYDPGHFSAHLVGMIQSAQSAHGIGPTSQVFDLVTGDSPAVTPSPAASLLVRLGVLAAIDLWGLAIPFGAVPERPLDAIFPLLASAALISGYRLTIDELDAAIGWLATPDGRAAAQMDAAIGASLDYALADLPVARQEQLATLAAEVDGASAAADGSFTSQVECVVVETVLKQLDTGQPPGSGFPLRSLRAKSIASSACTRQLSSADATRALELLDWAAAVSAEPSDDVLRKVALETILPSLAANVPLPELPRIAGEWPTLRTAMAAQIPALPAPQRQQVISGPAASIFDAADFAAHTGLCTEWLVAMVRQGALTRSKALELAGQIHDMSTGKSIIDEGLLSRLWGRSEWTIPESRYLLSVLPVSDLRRDVIGRRLMAPLYAASSRDVDQWIDYIRELAALPPGILNGKHADIVAEIASEVDILCRPNRREGLSEESIRALLERYPGGSPSLQLLLESRLPVILLEQVNLAQLLRRCPQRLFDCFCDYAGRELMTARLDLTSIAFLMIAMLKLRNHKANYGGLLEKRVLLPVLPAWKRREINALGEEMEHFFRGSRDELDLWYWRHSTKKRFLWQHRGKA